MNINNLTIGTILEVTTKNGLHYEKVIKTIPDVLTIDMPKDKNADVSTQGLTDNWKYRIVEDYEIAKALHRKPLILTDDHCVCAGDQYGFAINPNCLLHGRKQ